MPGYPVCVFLAATLAVAASGWPSAGDAQQTVIIGGSGLPAVEVNLNVLDSLSEPPSGAGVPARGGTRLGQPSTYAGVLAPGATRPLLVPGMPPTSVGPIKLIPPSEMVAPPSPAPATGVVVVPTLVLASPPPSPVVLLPPTEPSAVTPPAAPAPEPALTAQAVSPPAPAEPEVPASAPAPPPEPAPGAGEVETTVAAFTPLVDFDLSKTGRVLRIEFSGSETNVPEAVKPQLQALAEKLATSDPVRVQLKAYAGGTAGTASAARRLSLSRALAVRAFLIEQGVRSTRIDVRALGTKSGGGPPERLDIFLLPQ